MRKTSLDFTSFRCKNHDTSLNTMGILENIAGPLTEQVSQRGLTVVVAAGFFAFIVLSVVLNVLKQLLFKNPNEPPVVFHWFPVIGSTVTYGMAPYEFFFANRAKVCYNATRGGGTRTNAS